jgi:predicted acetyltransferase
VNFNYYFSIFVDNLYYWAVSNNHIYFIINYEKKLNDFIIITNGNVGIGSVAFINIY